MLARGKPPLFIYAGNGNRCPCCGCCMTSRAPRKGRPMPLNKRTQGHDVPVSYGGDPAEYVMICNRCNGDQGPRPFDVWASLLKRWRDPRAAAVARLAALIEEWRKL